MVGKGEIPVRRFNIKKQQQQQSTCNIKYQIWEIWDYYGEVGRAQVCRGLSILHEAPGQFLFVFK